MTAVTEKPPLDIKSPPPVRYAIEDWLKTEQVKLAIARQDVGRIQPHARREEPIAVVGFGPSLQDTWEQIRGFRYVITCSGSHRFLIDKGIVPTWHVEVDPRAHKVTLLGEPHPDVEYLVASTCHPKYFDHLAGRNVKLWHVFDASDEGLRMLPPDEWAVTGGCDAGLRAMTLAAFLGFRDLHIFGLDGCARGELRHAGEHPYGRQDYRPIEVKGQTFYTTAGMLAAATGTVHELEQMPAVRATFYGEGLTQALAKDYVPKQAHEPEKPYEGLIGFHKPAVISATYRQLNTQLHRDNLAYGVGGGKHASTVLKLVATLSKPGQPPVSVLDYGAGKGYLQKALSFPIFEYDPAVSGKQDTPRPADLVVCTDVLEHIEPECLPAVLADLRRCTKQIGYFTIHTGPARKTLADGRNAHLIQRDRQWWRQMLSTVFRIGTMKEKGPELYVVVSPRQAPSAKLATVSAEVSRMVKAS